MLVNVYLPIVWAAFLITLAPGILLARSIQRSLSITTGDYMALWYEHMGGADRLCGVNDHLSAGAGRVQSGHQAQHQKEYIPEYTGTE